MGKKKSKREERKTGESIADQLVALGLIKTDKAVKAEEAKKRDMTALTATPVAAVHAAKTEKVEEPVMKNNEFINPYTFIPIGEKEPDRKTVREALEGKKLYDGYLECNLEIQSSTYIPNTSKKFEYLGKRTEHYFNDFFSYEDLSACDSDEIPVKPPQYPRIPGSEIRGMVRNVYEQLTNSCLSVIDEENLPYKRTPKPKEAAILDISTNTLYKGELYKAQYRVNKKDPRINPTAEPGFGDIVNLKEATKLWFEANSKGYITSYSKDEKPGHKEGYLLIGEKLSFKNKKNVSIIVNTGKKPRKITNEDIQRFEAVLSRYDLGLTKEHEGYKEYIAVYEDMKNKKSGMLPVFYSQVGKSIYLSPAMITKEVFENTISDILRDNHNRHEPCSGEDGCFCPACRLFGMIGKGKDKNAIASRLRFTDTEIFDHPKFDVPKVPPVLGTPRYSSTEFYLKEPEKSLGAEMWNYDYYVKYHGAGMTAITEAKLYDAKLSGRKVYWQGEDKQADADKAGQIKNSYNNITAEEERINYIKNNQLKMRQAIRTLTSGIAGFRVYFENITEAELGNLIFCINLSGNALNRIGKGKPLGMGAVKTVVNNVELVGYKFKDGEILSNISSERPEHFDYEESYKNNAKNILKYLTPLKDIEAERVDYPRLDDTNNDKIFDWFTKNRGRTILQPRIKQTLPGLNDTKKYLSKKPIERNIVP